MRKDPLPLIFCVPDEDHATVVHALIAGPFDTPYEGGFFWFVLNCPDDYPNQPPKAKLMTTGGGGVRFNPNLYANGKVCLSILGTWQGPGWSPAQSLASVLMSIQSLMNEKPYHNEPGFEIARGTRDVENYNDCISYERLRVAVVDMCGDSSTARAMPEKLRKLARELFSSFAEGYHLACLGATQRGKDGALMADPFGENKGVMDYSGLKVRLTQLQKKIEEEEEEEEEVGEAESTESSKEAQAPAQAPADVAAAVRDEDDKEPRVEREDA